MPTWIESIKAMRTGDPCEWRYPARTEWLPGVVVVNGGPYFWTVAHPDGEVASRSLYAEHVRAPGGPSSSD